MRYLLTFLALTGCCLAQSWDGPRSTAKAAGSQPPFGVSVACGDVAGWTNVEKFGHLDSIDSDEMPATVWSAADSAYAGSEVYTFSSAAVSYYMSSSSASDTGDVTWVGITVDGDGDWNEETVTVTIAGQTKTEIESGSGDPWIRMYRGFNAGTAGFVGEIYAYEDTAVTAGVPNTDTAVRAVIVDGDNQTEMCVYTIPETVMHNGVRKRVICGVFMGGYVGIARSASATVAAIAEFTWRARPFGGVFQTKGRVEVQNRGSSWWAYTYPTAGVEVPIKTDVVIQAEVVSSNATGLVAGFGIYLKLEE